MPAIIPESAKLPGPFRRIGALIYDLLAVVAICMIASLPPVMINGAGFTTDDGPVYALYLAYVLILAIGYFVLSWRVKHCTIGMKAWRLELVNLNDGPFTWRQLITRAVVGILAWLPAGIGVWWQNMSASKRTWHDLASDTRVVVLKKQKR
ncbi:MAG: RDD family protein [Pseudomonadota bacterium]